MKLKKIILIIILLNSYFIWSQPNINNNELEKLSKTKKGLNEKVRVNLTGLTLYEFITALADEHKLNVSVDENLNQLVTSNFYDVSVLDVFMFLVEKHDLEVSVMNTIIVFDKKKEEIKPPKKKILKKIDVIYKAENDFLSIKLKNDSLPRVAQAITDVSEKNIVLSPNIKGTKVSAYILNRPFAQVIEMMAESNNLTVTNRGNDNYYLEKSNLNHKKSNNSSIKKSTKKISSKKSDQFEIEINPQGFLNIRAFDADASEMIVTAAEKLNINFFMYNNPEGIKTTLIANGITFDNLLDHLFKGEEYTYKKTDEIYLIGKHKTEGLRQVELVQLENRTIESVSTTIPPYISGELKIEEFKELNGFVVSGSKNQIQEFKDYIYEIDLVVPVIQIEVIIVQYQKSSEIQTGIKAGLDKQKRTTSGTLFPTSDMALNATSVNSLLNAFNGLGIVNLGKVTESFYLNLKALENNSLIKLSSTPKLVTLNGHEANSSIGETSYYFEQNNRLINNGINNNILQSGSWKSTEANLSINIKPTVSKDEHVTLNIAVEKSSFLARAGEDAPPGKATQKFESMIRVKNNEMILLGGLDELENENSGTGTPFLSKIPVLKWFFSGRKKRKDKSKLHIFIKPTVTY